MFNFIFDGKIGEMLAPVVPSNQLFLAIQHHKNDEIPALLLSMDVNNSQKLVEGGYSAIHVACRYNNRFALELLLSKGLLIHHACFRCLTILLEGVSLELADTAGNTPLHYASKYGHVELCKVLLERGSSLAKRNKQNQNAYDVSDSHVVRQYLLPLVFQAERSGPSDQQQDFYPQMGASGSPQLGHTANYVAPPTLNAHHHLNPFGQSSAGGLPTSSSLPPPVYSAGAPPLASGIVPSYSSHSALSGGAAKPTNMARTFQPGEQYVCWVCRAHLTHQTGSTRRPPTLSSSASMGTRAKR